MYKFTTDHWYRLRGRGFACRISETLPDDLYDPNQLYNQLVEINGEDFIVKGAESFAVPRTEDHPYSHKFSLLVEEPLERYVCD